MDLWQPIEFGRFYTCGVHFLYVGSLMPPSTLVFFSRFVQSVLMYGSGMCLDDFVGLLLT